MSSVSIVVCCYNSAERIAPTLKCLSELDVTSDLKLDIIVVDNASTDNTSEVANACWTKFGRTFPLRIVVESEPGLSHARNRGVTESNAEWILLCDDDNHLDHDYVIKLLKAAADFSNTGIVGGWGKPVFEREKPEWWEQAQMWYACGKLQEYSGEIKAVNGAGMLIRKEIFQAEVFRLPMFLTDRIKGNLISGGDVELCLRAKLAGYKVIYVEQATYGHWMPESRMTREYSRKLITGIGRGFELLKAYEPAIDNKVRLTARFFYGALRLVVLPSNTFGLSKVDILRIRMDSFRFFLANRSTIIKNHELIRKLK